MKLSLKFCLLFGILFNINALYSQNTVTLNAIKDNSIFSENASNSLGTGKLFTGQTCQDNSRRALIQFDLSNIPAGSIITEATLTLGAEQSGNQGDDSYSIYAVTQEWGEGFSSGSGRGGPAVAPDATWTDAMFGTTFWNTPGGDFDPTLLTSLFISENNQAVAFPSTANMIDQAQNWLENSTTNFGIILIGNEDVPCSAYRFGSKEIGIVPTLTISYEQGCAAETGEEIYTGCEGDGYSVIVNGNLYDENNPNGMELLSASNGCDSIVGIDLVFNDNSMSQQMFTACEGSGLSIDVNGTIYNENNPNGIEVFVAAGNNGCDSTVIIDLTFIPNRIRTENYSGCEGDGFSIVVNGTIYDENNPSGIEILTASNGCDSTITVALSFGNMIVRAETYNGCEGDGYMVNVNGTTYNESNPAGTEIIPLGNGCDSTVMVDLIFNDNPMSQQMFTACEGSGLSINVNGTIYNENNPNGIEVFVAGSFNGCDSTVIIDLIFVPNVTRTETHDRCEGDGFSITVNGTTYNENNPSGIEMLTASNGCDSTITVALSFSSNVMSEETYNGCNEDGFSIVVNGTTYNEFNPVGMEMLTTINGCDSIININLVFQETDNSVTVDEPSITATSTGTYQWVDCDNNNEPIPGATDQTFVATITGNYAVLITENNCTVTSDCNMITIVSTINTIIDQQVTLFPNPSNGIVHLNFGNLKDVTIKLRNSTGKLLLEMTDVSLPIQTIEIPGPAGIYLLEVGTAGGRRQFMLVK